MIRSSAPPLQSKTKIWKQSVSLQKTANREEVVGTKHRQISWLSTRRKVHDVVYICLLGMYDDLVGYQSCFTKVFVDTKLAEEGCTLSLKDNADP